MSIAVEAGTTPHRRAGTTSLVVATVLVLAWLATTLAWQDGWSEPTRANAFLLPPLLLLGSAIVSQLRTYLRRKPVAFEVRDGAFVAPPADRLSAATAMLALASAATAAGIYLLHRPADPHAGLSTGLGSCAALIAVVYLLRLVAWHRGLGRIELRPEGLRITYAFGGREVPWDAVAAGPARTPRVTEPRLRFGRPELVRATGLARRRATSVFLPTAEAWILREFLIDAITYYLATPAARESIGTAEGYEHLRRVLRVG